MSSPTKNEGLASLPSTSVEGPAAPASADGYLPPRVEDDLPLEVMSLACAGFRPKQSTPLPCRVLGSLFSQAAPAAPSSPRGCEGVSVSGGQHTGGLGVARKEKGLEPPLPGGRGLWSFQPGGGPKQITDSSGTARR
jgi:hypothetical protein